MFHTYIKKFNVTDTAQTFLPTKHGPSVSLLPENKRVDWTVQCSDRKSWAGVSCSSGLLFFLGFVLSTQLRRVLQSCWRGTNWTEMSWNQKKSTATRSIDVERTAGKVDPHYPLPVALTWRFMHVMWQHHESTWHKSKNSRTRTRTELTMFSGGGTSRFQAESNQTSQLPPC